MEKANEPVKSLPIRLNTQAEGNGIPSTYEQLGLLNTTFDAAENGFLSCRFFIGWMDPWTIY